MHTNTSLSLKGGINAFNDESKPLGLSETALYWIGGILKNAKAFTAITNPLVNSYKRLVPGFEAPVYIAWSDANRSAMIRIPAVRGNATRAEIRSVDPAANPYLAFSLILAAGLEGIQNKITPPKNVGENNYQLSAAKKSELNIEALPSNLDEALTYFKASKLAEDTLGSHIKEGFIKLKTKEWDAFRQTVTEWEINQNLRRY
jgi:glutamine synthetase